MKSQTTILEEHLVNGNRVTCLDVIRLCGTVNPTARISDVRKRFLNKLKTETVKTESGKRINRYYLEKQA